jgi:glycosyltransferase involved in cell wall biosynthesis
MNPTRDINVSERVHLSIVSPVYLAAGCLEELCRRVVAACGAITADFEIVLVDDSSPDDSWALVERLARNDPRIRGVQLARNFGQHHAVTAGLTAARGEWVVVMDCDLQDRPEEIPRLYEKATREGHLCVMARRNNRSDSAMKRLQSRAFYRVLGYLADLRELDHTISNFSISHRQVIDDIERMGEAARFYPGFLFWLGYPTAFVDVAHDPRFEGRTSYTFAKLLRHSSNIILSYSSKPLTLCVVTGAIMSAAAFVTALFYMAYALAYGTSVMGWPSLMITILFSTGTIVLTLGVLGLYIGRILAEVKMRPLYVVRRQTFDG